MQIKNLGIVLATTLVLAACGGGKKNQSPVGPTVTQPAVIVPAITGDVQCCQNPKDSVIVFLESNPIGDAPDGKICYVGAWGDGPTLAWPSSTISENAILPHVNPDTKLFTVTCKFSGREVSCPVEWPKCARQPGCNTCPPPKPKLTPKPTPPPGCGNNCPISCQVGDWYFQSAGPWGSCNNGQQSRTETWARNITRHPANGGQTCPNLTEPRTGTQSCQAVCGPVSITNFPGSTTVSSGSNLTINYGSSGAQVCVISGEGANGIGWTSGDRVPNGSYTTPPLTVSQTISMTCSCAVSPPANASMYVTVN